MSTQNRPSHAWYVMPIIAGVIGGAIMWFVVKDDDRNMARKGFIVGFLVTVAGLAVYIPFTVWWWML